MRSLRRSSLLNYDRKLLKSEGGIIGIDEAGRGAFAGPVVAGAAWLSKEFYERAGRFKKVKLINDSKVLKAPQREESLKLIETWSAQGLIKYSWAEGSVLEIENHNIIGATKLAMKRALKGVLETMPEEFRVREICELELWDRLHEKDKEIEAKILIDGLPLKPFGYPHQSIIEGDGQSLAIAMASIIAKVNRDRLMVESGKTYLGYGFEFHKGYGTEVHRDAIIEKGPTEIHRKKFLRNLMENLVYNAIDC